MEKIVTITIGEKNFKLTEDADFLMSDYQKFLKKRVKTEEQMLDIESQITYIFMSETEEKDISVTEKNVWSAIRVVADNERLYYKPSLKKQKKHHEKKRKAKQKNSFYKEDTKSHKAQKVIGGEAKELSERTGVNVRWIRFAFIVSTLLTGWTLGVYFALWINFENKITICSKNKGK